MRYLLLVLSLCLSVSAVAGDLYKIGITKSPEAIALQQQEAKIVLKLPNGYLVHIEDDSELAGYSNYTKVAESVDRDQLYLYRSPFVENAPEQNLLYRQDGIILYRFASPPVGYDFIPVKFSSFKINYKTESKKTASRSFALQDHDLDSLISLINADTLQYYNEQLQSYLYRLAGTQSNYNARDWIYDKLSSFGYDSVYLDPFTGQQLGGGSVNCYNVVAVKPGLKYPNKQIVIGGHFDAVPNSPGADDNASGTVAMLEIARVLADIPTDLTIIFIAFDSEESGLIGAKHYAGNAANRNDHIVLMINHDMIGHFENTDYANIRYVTNNDFTTQWASIAGDKLGLTTTFSYSGSSDHVPFDNEGYPAIFVQEKIFSTHYHSNRDSTSYMDFNYMTKLVKSSFGLLLSVDNQVPPIQYVDIQNPGDGQSLNIFWEYFDPVEIDYFRVYCFDYNTPGYYVDVPSTDTSVLITGLTEGHEYDIEIYAYDYMGQVVSESDVYYYTLTSYPEQPQYVYATPLRNSIQLTWHKNNYEYDFLNYYVYRNGTYIGQSYDSSFTDYDPVLLDGELYSYQILAHDNEDKLSDSSTTDPLVSRAITLQENKILIVNRTNHETTSFANEMLSGEFMRNTLAGYDYTYLSDTVSSLTDYLDLLSYELVVVSAEGVYFDEIARNFAADDLLKSLCDYMYHGGKVIFMGRFGHKYGYPMSIDYTLYDNYPDYYLAPYSLVTHIHTREEPETVFDGNTIHGDLIGATSLNSAYPELLYDSTLTEYHTELFNSPYGIPFSTYVTLKPGPEPLYQYVSRDQFSPQHGQTVAWKYFGNDYKYIFFEIPLSFFKEGPAMLALQTAVNELLDTPTDVSDGEPLLPTEFSLAQNYPNPFNPETIIEFSLPRASQVTLNVYNILGQKVAILTDQNYPAGNHTIRWDGKENASGIYFYRLETERFSATKKMLLLK